MSLLGKHVMRLKKLSFGFDDTDRTISVQVLCCNQIITQLSTEINCDFSGLLPLFGEQNFLKMSPLIMSINKRKTLAFPFCIVPSCSILCSCLCYLPESLSFVPESLLFAV